MIIRKRFLILFAIVAIVAFSEFLYFGGSHAVQASSETSDTGQIMSDR